MNEFIIQFIQKSKASTGHRYRFSDNNLPDDNWETIGEITADTRTWIEKAGINPDTGYIRVLSSTHRGRKTLYKVTKIFQGIVTQEVFRNKRGKAIGHYFRSPRVTS